MVGRAPAQVGRRVAARRASARFCHSTRLAPLVLPFASDCSRSGIRHRRLSIASFQRAPASREGTQWLSQILRRIEHGKGRMEDIALLESLAKGMAPAKTICALADAAAIPTLASVEHFEHELEEHVELGRCPFQTGSQIAIPELAHAR
ncbi:MAG: hypothetical protein FJ299_05920 [Planctomycetes bacterium]|nr:hypothetical protein [Planctomycetota bacterium]